MIYRCGIQVRKRADRDHRRKILAKKQRQHLQKIKTGDELRRIILSGRHGYKV